MLTESFMQRALLAALFLGPAAALLGVFVTARRMAFFSDTIAHAALAGIALGLWFGFFNPTFPMIIFSLVVAAAMMWLKSNTDLLTDTIMALLLSGSVALGIVILSLLEGRRGDLHRYLFGDILAVSWMDVGFAGALLVAVGGVVFTRLSDLTLLTANEALAHVCGVSVARLNYPFVVWLTVTVAMSIRLLGIILVTALLVIPPAAARNLSCNLRQQIVFSIMLGLAGSVGGAMLSYPLEVPCGPAIVLTCIALFCLSLVGKWQLARRAFR